jgi:hypothetical protein
VICGPPVFQRGTDDVIRTDDVITNPAILTAATLTARGPGTTLKARKSALIPDDEYGTGVVLR